MKYDENNFKTDNLCGLFLTWKYPVLPLKAAYFLNLSDMIKLQSGMKLACGNTFYRNAVK